MPENAKQQWSRGGLEPLNAPPGRGQGWRAGTGYLGQLQKLFLWPETLERLKRGEAALALAHWLAEEKGFPCNSIGGLANALRLYRNALPPGAVMPPVRHAERLETVEGLLWELEWAIREQVRRIRKGRAMEKTLPMPMKQVTADIDLLRRLIETGVHLMIELGLTKRTPQDLVMTPADFGLERSVYKDVVQLSPEARHRVLDVARRIAREAQAEALVAKLEVQRALPPGTGGEGGNGTPTGS